MICIEDFFDSNGKIELSSRLSLNDSMIEYSNRWTSIIFWNHQYNKIFENLFETSFRTINMNENCVAKLESRFI